MSSFTRGRGFIDEDAHMLTLLQDEAARKEKSAHLLKKKTTECDGRPQQIR